MIKTGDWKGYVPVLAVRMLNDRFVQMKQLIDIYEWDNVSMSFTRDELEQLIYIFGAIYEIVEKKRNSE